MPNYYRFEQQFFEYLKNVERNIKASPVYLGLGSGGGANIIGTLPQSRVSYDTNEYSKNTTSSVPTLIDNLNHIRYNIVTLQDAYLSGAGVPSGGGLTQGHIIYDDTVELTQREKLVILGSGVTVVDNPSNDSTNVTISPDFLDLTDTPSSYVTESGKVLAVNGSENYLEFVTITGVGAGNKIIRYDASGDIAEEYNVNESGLRSALTDATSSDIVLLPPQTITVEGDGLGYSGLGSLKINEGVTLKGMSREHSKIVATITEVKTSPRILVFCYDNARLENLTIEYTRSNVSSCLCIYYPASILNTGVTLKDVTMYAENTSGYMYGLSVQIKTYENEDNIAIDNCSFYTKGASAKNTLSLYDTYWNQKVTIRDSSFYAIDDVERATNYLYGLDIYGGTNCLSIDNCFIYAEIEVATTGRSRVFGIDGYGTIEIKNCVVIARNPGTYIETETIAIEFWANGYPNIPDDDKITDLVLIENTIGQAKSNSTATSTSYQTVGFKGSEVTMLNSFFTAECGGSSNQVLGAYIYADYYECTLRNSTFQGNTYDLYTYADEPINLYGCQYETIYEAYGNVTILQGDRASYYPELYHSEDIEDTSLTRHLPLPTTSGYIAVVSDGAWILSPVSGAGSGAGTFLDLTDTPSDYTGQLGEVLVVTPSEDGLEFTTMSGGGDMTKTIYDTNDDGVVDAAPWAGITDKPSVYPPDTHNHDSDYYTETEVDSKLALQDELVELTDTPSSYTGESSKILAVKETEDGLEFVTQSGTDFLNLTDTPSSYAGQAGRVPLVNDTETGLVLSGAGAGDMYKSTYDSNDDGIIDEIPWNSVTGKPTTFTPSTHNHDDRYYKETEIDLKFQEVDEFLDMDDAPTSYAGQAGKAVIVSDTEDQLEFVSVAGIGSGVEYKTLVSNNDTTPSFLLDKFIAGSGIVLSEIDDGGDESIIIDTTASGVGDMVKSVYDTNDDGVVDAVPWTGITGKPSTYPPDSHDHDDRYYTETEVNTKLALQDEFLELTDTPSSYAGHVGKSVVVAAGENSLEFVTVSGSGSDNTEPLFLARW